MKNRESYELIGNDLYHCWSVWNSSEKVLDVKAYIAELLYYSSFNGRIRGKYIGYLLHSDDYSKHIIAVLNDRLTKYERDE